MKRFNKHGEEIPDTTPVELPVGFRHPPSLAEEIRRLVEVNLSQAASQMGGETLDEASDFDVADEDELVVSGLQLQTMQDDVIMANDADEAHRIVNERSRDGREGEGPRGARGEGKASGDVGVGEAGGDSGKSDEEGARDSKGSDGKRDRGSSRGKRSDP